MIMDVPLRLATSWICQTNVIEKITQCIFHILNFSPALPSHCSLAPICYVFTWKPLPLTSIVSLVFHYNTLSTLRSEANNVDSNNHINDDEQPIIAYMVQGWIREVVWNVGRADCGREIRIILYMMYRSLWNIVLQFMKLILWSCAHGYLIMKYNMYWNWLKFQVKLVVYIENLAHDSNEIDRTYC
jgi:hypothetical protein